MFIIIEASVLSFSALMSSVYRKTFQQNLTNKQNRLQEEMSNISQRLESKNFVDRAPKDIVEQEKTNYNNLKNDIEKILLTIKGI